MILPLYSATGIALTPLIRMWLKRRALSGKEEPTRLSERFGHATRERPAGMLIWLHAASVGEVQSVLTLVRALLERYSQAQILVTTGTVTSAALVAQYYLARTTHQFVPVDTYMSVRRFLRYWRPDLALWVESEFWPQLLAQTQRRRIPILLVNARLSARSYARWSRWPGFIRRVLGCFDTIFAGSAEDALRLRALGAAQVIEAGNLKFDAAPLPVNNAANSSLIQEIEARPIWLAASTHANEEMIMAGAHRRIAQQFPNLLTIIVPRHAARGAAIAHELRRQGFRVAQRSMREHVGESVEIYLADTMGELGTFYALTNIVFLGGSLIAHGGHNPLEPARQHCAIFSGPHTHNFASIVVQMRNADALRIIDSGEALAAEVAHLLTNPARAEELAKHAEQVVAAARGASEAILTRIDALLQGSP